MRRRNKMERRKKWTAIVMRNSAYALEKLAVSCLQSFFTLPSTRNKKKLYENYVLRFFDLLDVCNFTSTITGERVVLLLLFEWDFRKSYKQFFPNSVCLFILFFLAFLIVCANWTKILTKHKKKKKKNKHISDVRDKCQWSDAKSIQKFLLWNFYLECIASAAHHTSLKSRIIYIHGRKF